MDEKLQDQTTDVSTPVTPVTPETPAVAETLEKDIAQEVPVGKHFNVRAYVGMVIAIVVIGVGLLFVLEKEGRISTGLFAGVIEKMEASQPAATVNGEIISKKDFKSSFDQLVNMSATQGVDTTDPAVNAELRTQAIETLVNGELLRQSAVAEGMTVEPEDVEARYAEIRDGLGGAEPLAARMAEFGVTEESLRKDIENEFLIQGLFEAKIDSKSITVSEDEIEALYAGAGGAEAGLPPLAEVRDQIVAQIRFDKEQVLINEYLEKIKGDSEVEISI